uniref:hypothetical protein n=1 Tax=Coprococcus catus TaxID=116085 RepID=UPI0022E451A6|nr:hypothetical protein [Coprococcus catus]
MKLYEINYMDDCDNETCLIVANNEEDAKRKFEEEIFSKLPCPMYYFVHEINEIDGHKIIVD